ncbi:prostatic acid phosphatase-like [Phymastichus coffea]|uniref:prostatic acid phosphatase-like n=1 Tax=Phymastichus coffea TaxID=108790 RepID=UPI00273A846E|nr:prostatic acid phosphatase-like [Phymastichus coffea]XP_058800489.1 prostatic acid phosphatase-like [Phymastichus coffea]XP_058800490.1 prostatic acid phosphatase-like [Phymastichus coffea]
MPILLSVLFALSLHSPTLVYAASIHGDALNENIVEDETVRDTLRQVNLVIRHGHRSPQSTYENDPYKNDAMEPFGWGQLTSEGRRSQYNQGIFLRKRYGHFLGTKYSPEIFWLQSTAVDRAKMSALLEAAALWKPDNDQTIVDGLAWQPTSLNYQTSDKDTLLLIWETCPEYARMREAVLKSPEIKQINKVNEDLYQVLEVHTGENMTNPDDVFDIFATLEAESSMNYTLPDWTQMYYPDKMRSLSSLSLQINVYNESLLKMKSAPLVSKVVSNMLQKSEGILVPSQRKMFMYVGHDSTVVNILEGMHVWDLQIPAYSTMVMIELHEDEGQYFVQLYLRNLTQYDPYPLTIPGCNFACPLDQFRSLLSPMIITEDEWNEECVLKDPKYMPGSVPLP